MSGAPAVQSPACSDRLNLEKSSVPSYNLVYLLYFHFDSSFGCKYTKDFLYKITSPQKVQKYLEPIENITIFIASLFNTNKPNICFWLRLANSAKMQKTNL